MCLLVSVHLHVRLHGPSFSLKPVETKATKSEGLLWLIYQPVYEPRAPGWPKMKYIQNFQPASLKKCYSSLKMGAY